MTRRRDAVDLSSVLLLALFLVALPRWPTSMIVCQSYVKRLPTPLVRPEAVKRTPMYKGNLTAVEQAIATCRTSERAIEDLDFALAQPPAAAAQLLVLRASVLAGRGEHVAAADTAEKLRELAPTEANNLYNVACALAQCVRAVVHQKKPEDLTDDDKAAQARYTARALDALAAAIDLGWKDRDHTEHDSDLDPIRENPKYQELTQRLNTRK